MVPSVCRVITIIVLGAFPMMLSACSIFEPVDSGGGSSPSSPTSPSATNSPSPPATPACDLTFGGIGCIQVQIAAQDFAQTLSGARRYDLYVTNGNDPAASSKTYACRANTIICLGLCGDGVRSTGASISGLPAIANATIIMVPQGTRGERGGGSWANVNLTRCVTNLLYTGANER